MTTGQPLERGLPRLPDFFVLGAGRCGSTSIHAVLGQHPGIFTSDPKEPTFFSRPFQHVIDPLTYADLFVSAGDRIAGEASHAYLSNPGTAAALRAYVPNAKFIVTVRNPADRALALHSKMIAYGYEWRSNFERALASEERRRRSARFERFVPTNPWNYFYVASGMFGAQMARYLHLYPRDAFYVTTLYDLIDRTSVVFDEIHDFLGVSARAVGELPQANESIGVKSGWLRIIEEQLVRRVGRRVPGANGLADRLSILNAAPKPDLAPLTRRWLESVFAPDLDHFAELTGVDVRQRELDFRARRQGPGHSSAKSV